MQLNNTSKVALVTGGAQRIGAAIVQALHFAGWNVVIHYHTAQALAQQLNTELNQTRAQSAGILAADLQDHGCYSTLVNNAVNMWGRLDALINNASIFLPSTLGAVNVDHWQQTVAVNIQAPFFLTQAAFPYLQQSQGSVINITDTHADGRPIKNYAVYSMSKAALLMQTQALARELAPHVRVNAVAPGVSLWDATHLTPLQEDILTRTPLKRSADGQEIANAVMYLLNDASCTTGSTLYVDGGRCIYN